MAQREAPLSVADLPDALSVFPVAGALLLPRGHLPLNVFEPRYLNMIDDAMSGDRIIGMIQPDGSGPPDCPGLMRVGCAGRIASYLETEDGRYLITLKGLCRFRVARELPLERPYRRIVADWSDYAGDFAPQTLPENFDPERLLASLRSWLSRRGLAADEAALRAAAGAGLVNALSVICPFRPVEKQALLEAGNGVERLKVLTALLDMDQGQGGAAGDTSGGPSPGGMLQ